MKHRKRLSADHFLNCWFPVFHLLLKGKLRGFILVAPAHMMGITLRGNYIHFKSSLMGDGLAPLWFHGYIEVCKPGEIKKRHRKIFLQRK